jgi:phosphatidylserine decarboxylase
MKHQYIERETSQIVTEKLFGDRIINLIYSQARENAPLLFKLVHSAYMSSFLGFVNFDLTLGAPLRGPQKFMRTLEIDLSECVSNPADLDNPRKIFERKIQYWRTRPMPDVPGSIVSPADARMLVCSISDTSVLFLKEKFFSFEELLGRNKKVWIHAFHEGECAIFRLTPEKYHYNHTPVAGKVIDIYEIPGYYHCCNPRAVVRVETPYSKNRRVVTIIDTDVEGGTHVGLVAMVEIVALMIGGICQCYSEYQYDSPQNIIKGMFLKKGQPKSLYKPGSSTDVLIFQKGRVRFSEDIVKNMYRQDIESRFSKGFGRPLVETEVKVRSIIARNT